MPTPTPPMPAPGMGGGMMPPSGMSMGGIAGVPQAPKPRGFGDTLGNYFRERMMNTRGSRLGDIAMGGAQGVQPNLQDPNQQQDLAMALARLLGQGQGRM